MIVQVVNYRIKRVLENINQQIYDNSVIIIQKGNCYYIIVLQENWQIKQCIISLQKPKLYPSLLTKTVYTNYDNFWNIYLRNYSPRSFPSFDLYQEWLVQSSNSVNVINIKRFQMFNFDKVELSSSQTNNIQTLIKWYNSNKSVFRNYPKQQVNIYNFFNFTLFQLSKRSLYVSDNHIKKYFRNMQIPQKLTIDLHNDRTLNIEGNINYNISSQSNQKWKSFRPQNRSNLLYRIDYSASYMQLLVQILQVDIDRQKDIYQTLKEQLKLPEELSREDVKQKVFSILFSNRILNHLDIQFFKMCYYFSKVLQQDYKKQGYIQSLISKKKIRLESQKINRNKLFNAFIMSLETQLYIGVLYNTLQFDRQKISPKLFIHDSIVFQVDVNWVIQNMTKIQDVLTFENKLKITRQLGRNLISFENIEI